MIARILDKPFAITLKPLADMHGNIGSCSTNDCRIDIASDLAPPERDETILHEIIHGISRNMAAALTESQVAALSVGLYASGYRPILEPSFEGDTL